MINSARCWATYLKKSDVMLREQYNYLNNYFKTDSLYLSSTLST